jgi:hypothetical protein
VDLSSLVLFSCRFVINKNNAYKVFLCEFLID